MPTSVRRLLSEAHLHVSGLTGGYRRGLPILHSVSIQVARGEIVALIGPNGAGKSTLIKAIAGQLLVFKGQIKVRDIDVTGLRPDLIARSGIGYVPQVANVFTSLTVQQNLVLAAQRLKRNRIQASERVLARFPDLGALLGTRAGALSGGQRQMLAMGMALVADPELLLLDEPTAGLSPKASQDVLEMVQQIARAGTTVLMVEQNVRAALRISDRAYVLAEGRNRLTGQATEIANDPAVSQIFLGTHTEGAA